MRMEELSDNRYIKNTDTVEKYLLNLVQDYFKSNNIASSTSREYIIAKAVERMKEEITFDNIGVLSITLPDGKAQTGAVNISLEDLNGEPLINPKLTAFNVDFGTERNTACEGNDPRLSDARKPLSHSHDISDVTGLEGILSTISGKINRVDNLMHIHKNASVINMLVYTGDKSTIDLTKIDTIENKVISLINDLENQIINYTQNIDDKIKHTNQDIVNVRTEINELTQRITQSNKAYYNQAKAYVDDSINVLKDFIDEEIDKLLSKDMLSHFINAANNVYSLVGSMSFPLNSVLGHSPIIDRRLTVFIPISKDILKELESRTQELSQCQLETILEYVDYEGIKQYCQLPYVFITNDYSLDGSLQLNTCFSKNEIQVVLHSYTGVYPDILKDAKVIYNVYSKKVISL